MEKKIIGNAAYDEGHTALGCEVEEQLSRRHQLYILANQINFRLRWCSDKNYTRAFVGVLHQQTCKLG